MAAHRTNGPESGFFSEDVPSNEKKVEFKIIYKDGKQGLANENGEVIIAPKYREIKINLDNSISVMPFTEWKILDGKNKLLKKIQFDFVTPVAKGLYKVGIKNETALANSSGELITKMQQWHIGDFVDGYAITRQEGKSGVINHKGVQLLPMKYDSLFISGGYVIAKTISSEKTSWTILNFAGDVLTDTNYQNIQERSGGLFAVKRNNSWGYIDIEEDNIVPYQYDGAGNFSERYAIASYMGSEGVINKKGQWVIMPKEDHLQKIEKGIYLFRSRDKSGLITVGDKILFSTSNPFIQLNNGFLEKNSVGKYGLIDHNGRRILVTEYDEISPLQQDTVYYFRKGAHWGILTKSGKVLHDLDNSVQDIYPMGEEFIGVKINNKYGFVDVNGDLRIANQYEGIGQFSEGLGAVKILGKWGYVDRIERLIIQPYYEEAHEFMHGLAKVMREGKYGLVDKEGELTLNTVFDSLTLNPHHRYISFRNGKVGLIGKSGHSLIYPKYDHLQDLGNGYVIIERNNEYGLVTTNGVSTIPLMYDTIQYDPYNNVYLAVNNPEWKKLSIVEKSTID